MIKNSFQILISDLEGETTPLIEKAISSFRNSLKECSYTLYNKEMIQELLALEFDNEVLNAFEKLKPFAFKADLARYCIAYKYNFGVIIMDRVLLLYPSSLMIYFTLFLY